MDRKIGQVIVDEALWNAVQEKLKAQAVRNGENRVTERCLLLGKLFDEAGQRLVPSHTNKRGRRYRYYVSPQNQSDQKQRWRLPGPEIEARVEAMVSEMMSDKSAIARAGMDAGLAESEIPRLLTVAAQDHGWADRVEYVQLGAEIRVRAIIPFIPPVKLERVFVIQMKRRGMETRIVIAGHDTSGPVDASMVKAIGRAMRWWDALRSDSIKSVAEIAAREGIKERYVQRLLPLAMLAPSIVQAIAMGKQPVTLTNQILSNEAALPLDWSQQRSLFGFKHSA